jgi:hypothetical protein
MTTSQTPGQDDNQLCQTFGVFIDLLGSKNRLLQLDRLAIDALPREQAIGIAKHALGPILDWRKLWANASETARAPFVSPAGAKAEAVEYMAAMDKFEIKSREFSDCIVINVIMDPSNVVPTLKGILMALVAISLTTAGMIEQGHLLRGGAEIGVGLRRPGSSEVLGSALVCAYELERHAGDVACTLIGPRAMGFLVNCAGASAGQLFELSELDARMCNRLADRILELLVNHEDGHRLDPFCAYLCKGAAATTFRTSIESGIRRLQAQIDEIRLDAASERRQSIEAKINWAIEDLLRAKSNFA